MLLYVYYHWHQRVNLDICTNFGLQFELHFKTYKKGKIGEMDFRFDVEPTKG